MFSEEILGEVRTYFWQRYDRMKEKDSDIREGWNGFMGLLVECGVREDRMGELEDGMIDLTAPMVMLAYFMGIQDGVDMLETLRDRHFTEKILGMYEAKKENIRVTPTA